MKLKSYTKPFAKPKLNRLFYLLVILLALGILESGLVIWKLANKADNKPAAGAADNNSQAKTQPDASSRYTIDEAASLFALVNKGRSLPAGYAPNTLVVPKLPLRLTSGSEEMYLRQDAAEQLVLMAQAAEKQGVKLMLASGYRSYGFQKSLYGSYVARDGQTEADKSSARAGHSEHQTGLAADLEPASRQCEIQICFADLAEGRWLAANAHKFGFIIRYPSSKESITGYEYEPWHLRYVGNELAQKVYASGQTLEQYLKMPTYPTYPEQIFSLK